MGKNSLDGPFFKVSFKQANTDIVFIDSYTNEEKDGYELKEISPFVEYTYYEFKDLSYISSPENDYSIGVNNSSNGITTTNFFKYTFEMQNRGDETGGFEIKISYKEKSSGSLKISDVLRVMFISDFYFDVFAKKSSTSHIGANGEVSYWSPIAVPEDQATSQYPFVGYAREFPSNSVIANIGRTGFWAGDVCPCTILIWLEGFDEDSQNALSPLEGTLKISVDIEAY